jgi:hypothetical protein
MAAGFCCVARRRFRIFRSSVWADRYNAFGLLWRVVDWFSLSPCFLHAVRHAHLTIRHRHSK